MELRCRESMVSPHVAGGSLETRYSRPGGRRYKFYLELTAAE